MIESEQRYAQTKTIAAISTAVGKGGIGIVRISGPMAYEILSKCFVSTKAEQGFVSHYAYFGSIVSEGKTLDRVIAIYMKAPHSYTGEDIAELQCHGGEKNMQAVLSLVLRQGAVLATPGEFTMRAFINGKMDLTQAEAIADIIDAKTLDTLSLSQAQLGGALSSQFALIEQKLLDLLASIEVGIDFPDDEDAADYDHAIAEMDTIIEEMRAMLEGAAHGRIYREGLRCVLAGEVNAGKSSLFNALLKQERAIVTDIPGTTRDTIEEYIDINGVPVLLIDTAGMRESAETVEAMGIERSIRSAKAAQLLLLLIDGSRSITAESRQLLEEYLPLSPIIILTKADMPDFNPELYIDLQQICGDKANISIISAKNGHGISELKQLIKAKSVGTDKPREGLINNLRHEQALQEALSILCEARANAAAHIDIDLLGIDLSNAYQKLGEITGKTAGEEVVNNIFAKFCLGK